MKKQKISNQYYLNEAAYRLKKISGPYVIALLSLSFAFLSLAFFISANAKSKYVPYMVQVDGNGSIVNVDKLEPNTPISNTIIAAFLSDFIEQVYSKSSDQNLQIQRIQKAYAAILYKSNAQKILDEHYQSFNYLDTKTPTIKTKIKSLVKLSKQSFAIDFATITSSNEIKDHKAILTFCLKKPSFKKLDDLRLNPLGVFISDLEVSLKLSNEDL